MIAGIARSRGAALATRNVADFVHCGIEIRQPLVLASCEADSLPPRGGSLLQIAAC